MGRGEGTLLAGGGGGRPPARIPDAGPLGRPNVRAPRPDGSMTATTISQIVCRSKVVYGKSIVCWEWSVGQDGAKGSAVRS